MKVLWKWIYPPASGVLCPPDPLLCVFGNGSMGVTSCNITEYALFSNKDLLCALNRVLNFIPYSVIPYSAFRVFTGSPEFIIHCHIIANGCHFDWHNKKEYSDNVQLQVAIMTETVQTKLSDHMAVGVDGWQTELNIFGTMPNDLLPVRQFPIRRLPVRWHTKH